MSGSGKVLTNHDVTERLSWETQAPVTVRPENFKPFPSNSDWQTERNQMKAICQQCHGDSWVNDFYDAFMEEANHLLKTGEKAYRWDPYPNATGDTKRPAAIFGE